MFQFSFFPELDYVQFVTEHSLPNTTRSHFWSTLGQLQSVHSLFTEDSRTSAQSPTSVVSGPGVREYHISRLVVPDLGMSWPRGYVLGPQSLIRWPKSFTGWKRGFIERTVLFGRFGQTFHREPLGRLPDLWDSRRKSTAPSKTRDSKGEVTPDSLYICSEVPGTSHGT